MRNSVVSNWKQCLLSTMTAIAVASFGYSTARAAPAAYAITDLGTLPGGPDSVAFSINSYGQIAGYSFGEAFLWTPNIPNGTTGGMIDLGRAAGEFDVLKVNDYGQVIFTDFSGTYLWTPNVPNGTTGSATDIGTLFGGVRAVTGMGLNNVGQISGFAYPGVCFLWTPVSPNSPTGTFNSYFNGTDYEPGFGYSSNGGAANAVNDSGQVTGTISDSFSYFPIIHSDPNDHYTTADIIPFYNPPDFRGIGWAINALGHVAGTAVFPGTSGAQRPFFYNGGMIDITSLEAGAAFGLNNNDAVVGKTNFPVIGGRPFLYTNPMLFDLNDLLAAGSGWTLTDVFSINDFGQMVGVGFHNGQTRGFLLTPQ